MWAIRHKGKESDNCGTRLFSKHVNVICTIAITLFMGAKTLLMKISLKFCPLYLAQNVIFFGKLVLDDRKVKSVKWERNITSRRKFLRLVSIAGLQNVHVYLITCYKLNYNWRKPKTLILGKWKLFQPDHIYKPSRLLAISILVLFFIRI